MSGDLQNPIFHNETKARKWLESHVWPDGPFCPHCGELEKITKLEGKKHRPGVYQCNGCRQQFTVTVGTLFERSKIPLSKWLMATYLLSASKKGMSTRQLSRMLGVSVKSSWFMTHRIREAMKEEAPKPMGGSGSAIQADETYIGKVKNPRTVRTDGKPFIKTGGGPSNKNAVVALVSEGKARTFHVKAADSKTVREILVKNAYRDSELHTDESRIYTRVGDEFKTHRKVNHSAKEYVGKHGQTINACENYFSIFKRGMKGVYQHCSEKHLQRYLTEFDFRYNTRKLTDSERTGLAAKGIQGKRLTYRRTSGGEPRP